MDSRSTALVVSLLLLTACSRRDAPKGPSLAEIDRAIEAAGPSGAVARLESLREEHGLTKEILLRLGQAYERQDELGRAVATYKSGLEADPLAGELSLALARIYMRLDQYERARDAFLAARKGGVGDDQISIELATCLGQLGDLDGADEEFRRAGAAGLPATIVDYNHAVVRMGRGHCREARDMLGKVLESDPGFHAARREFAQALLTCEKPDAATVQRVLDMAWECVRAMPEDWRSQDVLGQAYLELNDWEAAKAAFVEALRLGQNPPAVEDHYVRAEEMRRAAEKAAKASGAQPVH